MRTFWAVIITIVLITICGFAHADDSTARVGAGGITFLKSTDIRMLQEILKISTSNIYVRYRFINESNEDILTTVAFPLPPYGWNPGLSAGDENNKPLESFSILIDGQAIKTVKTRRAVLANKHSIAKNKTAKKIINRDITEDLKAAGLSETQIFKSFGDVFIDSKGLIQNGLNKQQETKLKAIGVLDGNWPKWEVAEMVHWEQLFPAKKEIEIEHKYKPFVGIRYTSTHKGSPFEYIGKNDEVCLTKKTLTEINQKAQKLIDKNKSSVTIYLKEVEFILGTGRNWKGPIGDFILSIEKDSPDQIFSTCFPGKSKIINQTTIEYGQMNYIPQDKLVVYFYTLVPEKY
ncbi:MAG: hypothetical protein APR62_04315 [Smithella sp. SDB]|nr:MAG: hypothetical protein APR62_04315 [Smithella sp. SDB]